MKELLQLIKLQENIPSDIDSEVYDIAVGKYKINDSFISNLKKNFNLKWQKR